MPQLPVYSTLSSMSRTGQTRPIPVDGQVLPPKVLLRRLGMLMLAAILAALDRGFMQPLIGPVWIHSL